MIIWKCSNRVRRNKLRCWNFLLVVETSSVTCSVLLSTFCPTVLVNCCKLLITDSWLIATNQDGIVQPGEILFFHNMWWHRSVSKSIVPEKMVKTQNRREYDTSRHPGLTNCISVILAPKPCNYSYDSQKLFLRLSSTIFWGMLRYKAFLSSFIQFHMKRS